VRPSRSFAAEFIGTAFLLAAIVGSGIQAEHLASGNTAIALLANTIATGAALIALVATFASMSGAHFNPLVSFAEAMLGRLRWKLALLHTVGQITGGIFGVVLAHVMFELPVVSLSQHTRSGSGQWLGEVVATFGLITVILNVAKHRSSSIAVAVAAYISAAYWFTSSTSFANPAVTIARSLSDTFTGIRPSDAPAFVLCQFTGATLAVLVFRWFEMSGRVESR
jgi:glycerol uptake facilitator-like aquaporin